MITPTAERVERHTAESINEKNLKEIEASIKKYSGAGLYSIDRRLEKLDREWTVERAIEVEAPLMISLGAGLTYYFGRKWLALPVFSASMLLLHGVKGWYPLLPIFRRLGLRTQNEILRERRGLKALRGDQKRFIKH